jgi:hypothetical protein
MMANDNETNDRPGTLNEPGDPPNVLLRPDTRRAALFSYLGPVIALFAIVGVALIYWVNRGPVPARENPDRGVIGTSGRTLPGGGDPQPEYDRTRDEIANRGGIDRADEARRNNLSALTTIDRVLTTDSNTARPVTLSAVEVEKAEGNTIWVRDGDARIAVALPQGAAAPQRGDRVDVSGITERRDGATQIVADAIHTK